MIARLYVLEEIWKDIEGFEGKYAVSNLGNVYSYYLKRNLKFNIKENKYYGELKFKAADKLLEHSRLSRKLFGSGCAFLGSCGICLNNVGNAVYLAIDSPYHFGLLNACLGNTLYQLLNGFGIFAE